MFGEYVLLSFTVDRRPYSTLTDQLLSPLPSDVSLENVVIDTLGNIRKNNFITRQRLRNPLMNRSAVVRYQLGNPEIGRAARSRYEHTNPRRKVERLALP
ncbi:hypothetical protein QTP88_025284 [Uroleucon formosanum]